ncbi:MAG: DUF4269 domain-containing protein [Marinisporobacter sp.]|jgi:hypothetical protein|nr:DUF4269 domain-containing protein [Marinisporobacter sp.]
MAYIWENISYLLNGNDKQKKAYETLKKIEVFHILKKFNPILVGTIPINIDTENSDLDIICEVYDFDEFEGILRTHFKGMTGLKINKDEREGIKNLVANFIYGEFIIEIFGQPVPTTKQNGYKHMIIEERLLKIGGDEFKREIIKLKKEGIKTEPAFARRLNIEGNPYFELLKLEDFSDEKLLEMIHYNRI